METLLLLPALLPVVCFVTILIFFLEIQNNEFGLGSFRIAFLNAAVFWGALVVALTETLNSLNAFHFLGLVTGWLLCTIIILISYIRNFRKSPFQSIFNRWCRDWNSLIKMNFSARLLIGGLSLVTLGVALVAVISAPNTSDAMVYHMSRVAHWVQNQSIEHYPTVTLRQLFQCPWTEFVIANFQILSGTDLFANMVQFMSFAGCIIGVSLIAKTMGARTSGQVLSSVMTATIPMAILQASSAKNDLAVSFWLLAFVHYFLNFRKDPRLDSALGMGLSLGLAILTKQTAYIFALGFVIWFLILILKHLKIRSSKPLLVLMITAILINGGFWARNIQLFGSPLGVESHRNIKGELYPHTNESLNPQLLASNIVRNISLHAGGPFESVNRLFERGIRRFHDWIGVDTNDPRNNMLSHEPYRFEGLSTNEDIAGNPLHLILLIIGAGVFLLRIRKADRAQGSYFACVVLGFALFSALIKWMPYNTRLHLPLFILAMPWLGLQLQHIHSKITLTLALITLAASVYWVGWNEFRPLVGPNSVLMTTRSYQYFNNRPHLRKGFIEAAYFIRSRNYRRVGLMIRDSDFEYPLWALLTEANDGIHIEHIDVPNLSSRLSKDFFLPEVVVSTGFTGRMTRQTVEEYAKKMGGMHVFGHVYVFAPK